MGTVSDATSVSSDQHCKVHRIVSCHAEYIPHEGHATTCFKMEWKEDVKAGDMLTYYSEYWVNDCTGLSLILQNDNKAIVDTPFSKSSKHRLCAHIYQHLLLPLDHARGRDAARAAVARVRVLKKGRLAADDLITKNNSCRIDTSGMCHNLKVFVADEGNVDVRDISVFIDAPPTSLSHYTSVVSLVPRYRVFNFAESGSIYVRQAGARRFTSVAADIGAPMYLSGTTQLFLQFSMRSAWRSKDKSTLHRRWSKAVSLTAIGETFISVPARDAEFVDLRVEVVPLPQLSIQAGAEAAGKSGTLRSAHTGVVVRSVPPAGELSSVAKSPVSAVAKPDGVDEGGKAAAIVGTGQKATKTSTDSPQRQRWLPSVLRRSDNSCLCILDNRTHFEMWLVQMVRDSDTIISCCLNRYLW